VKAPASSPQVQEQHAAAIAPPATPEGQAIKTELLAALEGTDRGIFGVPAAKRAAILELVSRLEATNPVPAPARSLPLCDGPWTLLFSTIVITGVKRTKLGLREFIRLGELQQGIDVAKGEATNTVAFWVAGLSSVRGALRIRATFTPASDTRVDIAFQDATLAPAKLQKLFEANYDLLLSIFNPQGHLDITYLDDTHRVGRDDKGNVFLLRRGAPSEKQ